MTSLYDFSATSLAGSPVDLASYTDQVVMVVNTASRCAFTGQYAGLQQLQDEYADRGFTVLGFPCDQFMHEEPGNSDQIGEFCQRNYGVTFPMFEKIRVNGAKAHPLYAWLKSQRGGLLSGAIKWNFTKFLVGRDGQVIGRYPSTVTPAQLRGDIEAALAVTDSLTS
jgi:glutathione peroxidase